MKTLSKIRIILLSFMLLFLTGSMIKVNAQPGINVSFQQFYDELSPYGEWVDDPDYGYIWVPNVAPDFQPYATNGQWVMTDYGNTWVSNYDWGWAPFHYGRWNYHNRFGWSWVPGYEWGPAWVNWRSGGGYYGWAPLGPGVSIGVSVNIPTNYWVFVPQRYLLSSSIHRYYAPRRTVVNVYNHTTIINNTYVHNNRSYVSGPRRSDIQRITRTNVPVHRITNASRPGSSRVNGRSVEIYRPNVSRNEQARPSRVTASNSVRANSSGDRVNSSRGTSTARPSTSGGNERIGSSRTSATSTTGTRTGTQRANKGSSSTQSSRPATSSRSTSERSNNSRPAARVAPNKAQTRGNSGGSSTPRVNSPTVDRSSGSRASGNSSTPARVTPQKTERSTPQRTERSAPQPRTEKPTPQRVERPSAPSRSSSSSAPSRSSSGSSRPSRSTRG